MTRRSDVGQLFRLVRARLDLSQRDAADAFDLTKHTISNYERSGAPNILRYAALGLLIARGVSVDEARRLVNI